MSLPASILSQVFDLCCKDEKKQDGWLLCRHRQLSKNKCFVVLFFNPCVRDQLRCWIYLTVVAFYVPWETWQLRSGASVCKPGPTHKNIKSDQHQFLCSLHGELNCVNILWAAVGFMWCVCELKCVPVGICNSTDMYTVYVSVWTSICVCESEWREHMDSALPSCWEGNNVEVCEPQLDLRPLRMTHTHTHTRINTDTYIYADIHPHSAGQLSSLSGRLMQRRRGGRVIVGRADRLFSQAARVSLEFNRIFLNPCVTRQGKRHTGSSFFPPISNMSSNCRSRSPHESLTAVCEQ